MIAGWAATAAMVAPSKKLCGRMMRKGAAKRGLNIIPLYLVLFMFWLVKIKMGTFETGAL